MPAPIATPHTTGSYLEVRREETIRQDRFEQGTREGKAEDFFDRQRGVVPLACAGAHYHLPAHSRLRIAIRDQELEK